MKYLAKAGTRGRSGETLKRVSMETLFHYRGIRGLQLFHKLPDRQSSEGSFCVIRKPNASRELINTLF